MAEAKTAYPNECCGLLAGRTDNRGDVIVTRVCPSPNVADSNATSPGQASGGVRDRFEVDPKIRFDLMRALNGSDEQIVGHYHSHPDHQAVPSPRDLEMAFEPDLIWIIQAVANGHTGAMTAHRLDRDKGTIMELDLQITQGTSNELL